MEDIYQVITKFLDGKHKTLNFTTPTIPILSIKARIQELTAIPIADQLLLSNGKPLDNTQLLARSDITHHFPTVHLLLRLRGGKGGFGSLLRGAATKAGQKKTNNFDACRDMSGRRLRHVNTEKKLEEWNAEKKDRELEKIAEDYIKKRVKMAKKSGQGGDGGAEKYVEKYRKDSAKCMEEVDKSVRESLVNAFKGKRKSVVKEGEKSKSKKLKIWMGKRKVDESDSDEEDDDSDDAMDEETEKSVVINNENHSDSKKEADGSSASVTDGKLDGGSSVGCSSESGSEEEKETIPDGGSRSVQDSDSGSLNDEKDDLSKPVLELHEESIVQNKDSDVAAKCGNEAIPAELDQSNKMEVGTVEEAICQASVVDIVQETGVSTTDIKPVVDDAETVTANSDGPDLEKPLNFDDFNSATEMEVLGMERLKSELQSSGLKCGGTLQERATRLFLLKTIPLEKLPKKLLAKK